MRGSGKGADCKKGSGQVCHCSDCAVIQVCNQCLLPKILSETSSKPLSDNKKIPPKICRCFSRVNVPVATSSRPPFQPRQPVIFVRGPLIAYSPLLPQYVPRMPLPFPNYVPIAQPNSSPPPYLHPVMFQSRPTVTYRRRFPTLLPSPVDTQGDDSVPPEVSKACKQKVTDWLSKQDFRAHMEIPPYSTKTSTKSRNKQQKVENLELQNFTFRDNPSGGASSSTTNRMFNEEEILDLSSRRLQSQRYNIEATNEDSRINNESFNRNKDISSNEDIRGSTILKNRSKSLHPSSTAVSGEDCVHNQSFNRETINDLNKGNHSGTNDASNQDCELEDLSSNKMETRALNKRKNFRVRRTKNYEDDGEHDEKENEDIDEGN